DARGRRVEHRRQRLQPPVVPPVPQRRHDQQVPRPRRGDVQYPRRLLTLPRHLLRRMLVQLRRRAPRELLDTEPAIRIDPPSRLLGVSLQVRSARMTTGNSSPFAPWTVIMRTPSVPSSTIGASPASPCSACSASHSTKARKEVTPVRSARRARSIKRVTLASACSPV